VTSSLNINFLARPAPNDMTALVKLIRLGRRSAVGEVELYSEGVPEMVAHATANYALRSP
jgi:acyl-coenzyme A thioesterase PaaI-like protein